MKKVTRKAAESAQAILEGWERTLELSNDLSPNELLALIPKIQNALATNIGELLARRFPNREARRLNVVLGKLLTRIERRIKRV